MQNIVTGNTSSIFLQLRISFCFHNANLVTLNQVQDLEDVIFATASWYVIWNLNSITVYNLEKLNLFEAYNTINKFDVICLSESYLESSIASDNDDLNINGSWFFTVLIWLPY